MCIERWVGRGSARKRCSEEQEMHSGVGIGERGRDQWSSGGVAGSAVGGEKVVMRQEREQGALMGSAREP